MRFPFTRYFAACSSILLLIVSLSANAQPAVAGTPAAKVFAAWLEAFNSGDPAQFKAFDDKYKPDPPMAQDGDFQKMVGGFSLVRVESDEPTKFVALMKEKASPNMGRIELTISDEAQPKVLGIEIRLVPAQTAGPGGPPPAPVARLTQKEAIAATNKRLDELAAADQFSGAVLVAQNGKPLMTRAVGMQDREKKIPNSPTTKFRIGSMNKMFTSVATLQLVERGKLSLDDTLGKHLSNYPNKELASKVTIRHLLTHAGGTGDIFDPEFEKNRLTLKTPSDYVKLYGNRAPEFAPGSDSRYSNYGYVLLGAIIEKITGQSYDDYVQKNIFALAGMKDTGALPESQSVANRAVGYMRPQGKLVPNTETLPWSGSPAGGGYSTVGDLMRFAMALQSGKLISKKMLDDATTIKQKGYGFGFGIRGSGEWKGFGHGGGSPGMNGELRIIPEQGYVVVALSNLDPPSAEQIVGFVAARLPANATTSAVERVEVPINANAKRPAIMARVNGGEPIEITYDTGSQGAVIAKSLADKLGLAVIGEVLIGSPEGGKPVPAKLVSIGELTVGGFAARTTEAVVMDDASLPKGSTIIIGNNEFPNARIELDFANSKLRLSKSSGAGTADWSPLSERGFAEATIQIGSESIPLHIDSGNPGWLDIPKSFATRLPLKSPLVEAPAIRLVDKEIPRFSAEMDTAARIGNTDVVLRGPFMFADLRSANLGAAALKTASLIIDMPSRKWTLSFGPKNAVPVIAPTVLLRV